MRLQLGTPESILRPVALVQDLRTPLRRGFLLIALGHETKGQECLFRLRQELPNLEGTNILPIFLPNIKGLQRGQKALISGPIYQPKHAETLAT